jgi:hypothetical protein
LSALIGSPPGDPSGEFSSDQIFGQGTGQGIDIDLGELAGGPDDSDEPAPSARVPLDNMIDFDAFDAATERAGPRKKRPR